MVLIKLINGTVLGAFATTPFVKSQGRFPEKGSGLLYSSQSKKTYRLKQDAEAMAITYNDYFLMWGNA